MVDEMRERYPGIFAAVRVKTIPIDLDLVRYIVHWLGDYARVKEQPGQPGVPEGVIPAQRALAEACAAMSDSRQREDPCLDGAGIVISGHEAYVDTAQAAALLGCTADNARDHCRRGNLEHRKIGRQVMITVSSIESLKVRLDERKGA